MTNVLQTFDYRLFKNTHILLNVGMTSCDARLESCLISRETIKIECIDIRYKTQYNF